MFLDPDPKRQRQNGSGFFSSQRPVVSPRDRSAAWRRKYLQPLEERSQSENNQQNPDTSLPRPTVRLVKPLPASPTGSESEEDGGFEDRKENRQDWQNLEHLPSSPTTIAEASVLKPGSSGSADSDQGFHVSSTHTRANEAQSSARFGHDNLLPSTSGYTISRPEWHRRSGSSDFYSNTSTLREDWSGYEQKSLRTESRISEGSTLRQIPTPTEQEHRERVGGEETSRQASSARLQPLEESSLERSTVRLVPTPLERSSSNNRSPPDLFPSSTARPHTSPSDSEREATFSQRSSRRSSSAGSLPAPHNIRNLPASPSPRHQRSQESVAQSEASVPSASSPNLVPFYSDSSRPQPLHAAASVESIQSRLDNPSATRPATRLSAASHNSWSSRSAASDTLPPLHLPKKRVRHKPASSALNATAASATGSAMEDTDIDTEPYPRHPFSMHLSTIASESDPQSRTASQHLSHFSLGSGVLTGDDSSSIPNSGKLHQQRQESVYEDYPASEVSPIEPGRESTEEPGDMTMGLFRQESALPEPLFHARSPSAPLTQKKYDGPLPPLPPIPRSRESDECFDMVPEMARPSLHERRSGYSLRRKSQTTPSHSHSRQVSQTTESSRWSQGTTIFPQWAKAYYAYGATLLSSSQISLSAPEETNRTQNLHPYRFNRDWRDPSLSPSFGTGASSIASGSPAGSRFLPNIFRPRAKRDKSGSSKKWKMKSSKTSPREADNRPDSMAITRDPLPFGQQEALLSDQPKYGSLKDESERHRPLPRTYSKQKKWDEMQFPRPMSKDILGGNDWGPHLGPSKRTGKVMSAWRAPSFVESLDTLVRSRCNRQILFFVLGFICPLFWMIGSVLPLPKKPMSSSEFEKAQVFGGSEEDIQAAMMRHEAGDAEKRWREERQWMKARWWRYLNRIMSVIGVLVIGAVIALVIVATSK